MAEFCDIETISKAVGVPAEIIKGVLDGSIAEETLKNYDPSRPPELKIIETEKYVRGRTIGIISTGGCGATTLTAALGVRLSEESDKSVLLIDMNEYSVLGNLLGFEVNPNACNKAGVQTKKNLGMIQHPISIKDYSKTISARISELPKINAGLAIIDGPNNPIIWEEFVSQVDQVFLVIRPDENSLLKLIRLQDIIQGFKEKLFLVVNAIDSFNTDFHQISKELGLSVLMVIPNDRKFTELNKTKTIWHIRQTQYYHALDKAVDLILTNKKEKKGFIKSIANVIFK